MVMKILPLNYVVGHKDIKLPVISSDWKVCEHEEIELIGVINYAKRMEIVIFLTIM